MSGSFITSIVGDIVFKRVKQNEVLRASQLRDIITSLGPAYIKLGQALSIRPDILSPAAMNELQKLCDKVGPNRARRQRIYPEREPTARVEREYTRVL